MKKIILAAVVVFFTVSCSSKEESPTKDSIAIDYEQMAKEYDEFKKANQNDAPKVDPAVRGKALVEGSDCLSCHNVDTKVIGPSYHEVAAKYTEADIDQLAQKIIDGGKGIWGEIPMTPHPGVNKEDAKQMVKYILALNK